MPGKRVCFNNPFIAFKEEDIEQSIPSRFEAMVEKYPNRLAVKDKNYALTYRELNHAANRLAWAIRQKTPKGNGPVGVFLQQGVSLVTALLATLKAGKIYVPLDPYFTNARVTSILDGLHAEMIITDEEHLRAGKHLSRKGTKFLVWSDIDDELSVENPPNGNSPDTLASILYTSGSTGEPKGVVHSHRNVLHMTMSYTNPLHIGCDDRIALLFTPTVISALRSSCLALLNGAALFPYDIREEGLSQLKPWFNQEKITFSHWVTSVFRHFALTLHETDTFPHHRLLWVGGEPVYKQDIAFYKKHFPRECRFMNALGITEAGNICLYLLDQRTSFPGNVVPVGYAVAGADVVLFDQNRNEVPSGAIGEIAVRSQHLSLGYWNRPDLTKMSFVSDPDAPDTRMYLTGDLGRKIEDDCLVHMGRKDSQVKIRGFRVELAEIESALLELSVVQEVVVTAHSDTPGEIRLVAYIVPASNPPPAISELRHRLATTLPDYMIPSAFIMMDILPLTATGKVDRGALPKPGKARPALEVPYVAPHTSIEKELEQIWSEVLGLEQIGMHDPFLELGGDSLRATRLISRLLDRFQVEVPMQALLEAATIADMAEAILIHKTHHIDPAEMDRLLDDVENG